MQQRNEKATEPSMEDILASIRKIISEEPAEAKGAAKAVPVPMPAMMPPPKLSPAASMSPVAAPIAARPIEDVAPPIVAAPSSRLSDFVRELAPSAVPLSAATAGAFHDDFADLVESDRPAPAAVPPKTEIGPAVAEVSPVVTPAAARVEPVAVAPPRAPEIRNAEFGAFIPASAESIGMSSPHRPNHSFAPEFRSFDLPKAIPAAREPSAPSVVLREPPALTAIQEPEAAVDPADDAVAAAQSALGALAKGLATPPAVIDEPQSVVAEPAPAVVATRKSLDDSVVEMLRPMIGDWLDAHLPEMVEQALRQELAERGKSGR